MDAKILYEIYTTTRTMGLHDLTFVMGQYHAALVPVPGAGCAQPPVIRGEIPPEPRVIGPRAVDHHPTGPDGPAPEVTVIVRQQGLVQPH